MTRAWVILLAVAVGACGAQPATSSAASPSVVPTSAPVSSSTTVGVIESTRPAMPGPTTGYETATCEGGSLPVGFAVLCEAYAIVDAVYVDPVDPAALASAAVLGVRQAEEGDPAGATGALTCHIPDPAFEVVCAAVAERLSQGTGSAQDLLEHAVLGMFRFGLDPFSVYVPPEQSPPQSFVSGFVYELGLVVSARTPDGGACGPIGDTCALTVMSVFDFTPAAEAGLEVGDRIVSVDGTPVEGLAGDEAALLLGGPAGSGVVIGVEQADATAEIEMTRADIRFEPAEFAMMDDGIAYVRLNDFSQAAAIALGTALARPDVQDASGLVLDLRDNPGGLVLAAQAVASQFLGDGDVMVEEHREGRTAIPVIEGGIAVDGPSLVVLVNGASASAAEIVAAVLSERGRATVVGTSTFGKNLVQHVLPGPVGGEIRVTTARWTTPGGGGVGIVGMEPDVFVEDTGEGDPQLETAIDLLS